LRFQFVNGIIERMSSSNGKTEYNPNAIETKWQIKWREDKTFSPDLKGSSKPFYNLMMFPYPSAEGLHVGNMYAFTGADVYGRFMRMHGFDVFEPIGLDGFGIHSENFALQVGRHPAEQAKLSAKNYYRQLEATGNAYDWERTLETYDPEYYRWTQWLFVQMFKKGLAYRKKAQVNWCPRDLTVLADEQVIDGKCERDGSIIEKRDLVQWFFKITDYADRLLEGLSRIDWPEKIKTAQRQWIGKSEGAIVRFQITDNKSKDNKNNPISNIQDPMSKSPASDFIEVFTTRPDTLHGATFMVIAPEHKLVTSLLVESGSMNQESREKVRKYVEASKKTSEQERMEEGREKTGVFSGLYAINPVNNEKIPVWVADYILIGYGTGAVMAVPAHDQRDFEFAKKYDLPIKQVISPDSKFGKPLGKLKKAYLGSGGIVNSGDDWEDFAVPAAMPKILNWLEEKGIGKREANYHLRDWLISRQRYWGPPIPMIYCLSCEKKGKGERDEMAGWYTVSPDELPIVLPDVEDWKPQGSGTSPLANHPEFYETKCPSCEAPAKRETDVSDTFLDSAWYYLRYLSIGTDSAIKMPYDIETVSKWCPVSIYIGGAEHSVLHLLYVRFVAMALHDLDSEREGNPSELSGPNGKSLVLPFREPFPKFFAHGLIVKDHAKMSKSRGNIVIPDAYIEKFGADTLRMYLMFLGQFSEGGDFRDTGIEGMGRFVKRVWALLTQTQKSIVPGLAKRSGAGKTQNLSSERLRFMHKTTKAVTEDIEQFSYNTAIARMMEWYNFLKSEVRDMNSDLTEEEVRTFTKLLAPFAPHMTEELWERLDLGSETIHKSEWPKYDEKYLVEDFVTVAIQLNGKRRGEVTVENIILNRKDKIEELAKEQVQKHLEGKEVKKVIYVPGKIINFVI